MSEARDTVGYSVEDGVVRIGIRNPPVNALVRDVRAALVAALDRAFAYVQGRKQFGRAIIDFQATQFKLADMETELAAARSLLYDAARKVDAGAPDKTKFCAMAKRFVTDTAFKVANDALQLHGGYGYLGDYEVERIVRDLRVHQILEGTNEIMRVIVAREMMRGQV